MGWFKSDGAGDKPSTFGNDGRGGFTSVGSDGVTSATGGDPVDNLINLAREFADLDGE